MTLKTGDFGVVAVALLSARKGTMPYATGEIPVPGDYVKNQFERTGTVTKVRIESDDHDFVSIRWDVGGVDSPLTPPKEFILISREA